MRPTAQCVLPDPNRLETCIGDLSLIDKLYAQASMGRTDRAFDSGTVYLPKRTTTPALRLSEFCTLVVVFGNWVRR
jgi:hypothetical protein